jgi:hypothetical protein
MTLTDYLKGLVIPLLFLGLFIYVHEITHQQIFSLYGCSSHTGMDSQGFFTKPTCPVMTEQMESSLLLAQSNVENMGYQISGVLTLLLLIYNKD